MDQLTDTLLRTHFQWKYRKPYIFRANALNAFLAFTSYHLVSSHYDVSEAVLDSVADILVIYKVISREYNSLSSLIKNFVLLVLCAPLFYHAFQYCSVRIFKMERLMTPHIRSLSLLKREIEQNITSLRTGKRDLLLQKLKEITAGIGYDIREDGLVAQERIFFYNDYDTSIRTPSLSKIQDIIHELETITLPPNTNQTYLCRLEQDIFNLIQQNLSERIFGLSYYEQFLYTSIKNNDRFKACIDYFTKNRNQIYKYKFTTAKIVRKEALERLDYYEGIAFEKVTKYKADMDNYYFCLLENQCRLNSFIIRLQRKLYTTHFTGHIVVIMKNALREYWRILSRLVA
ncbi:hypothetical protein [Paenibacillus sp. PAMC21692]|uniref:hypothetical protein n=1 Tax=Paenibacillus sp. PAMC21692 TaxID=2762320 RepID=UPI00164E2840|nr:hypothetical protein [Paenibacillus sp. PAMC21692]QNK55942.1 hypothetical protein H7F31_25670 [Paenibacillus sp. PAMC21692]